MEESVKRRLLGLSVIVVAAVVLFPLFLTGEGYRERHLESRIPPAPSMPDVVSFEPQTKLLPDTSEYAPIQKAPEEVVVLVEKKPEKKAVTQEKRPVVSTRTDKPQLDEQNVPVAWTLQLASFKDESNARALRKQLVEAGHKVYTRKNANLFKVYVGPDMKRQRLEKLKAALQSDFGLDGIIFRFTTQ
ncbi:SPOR domain-containing protein [Neptunomonas japonica]|uniref:DedD protein n=1 Tax=Neptunomonas japonica JAMM 1380 TaxID=1441457 RepID=A0A7R6P8Z0_9GAMM|nr:SPOR domain-containing protein [Neptunomonas japonica]BBB29433.1 DedD protein [Neptunomonas japonica JAMM 1380]